MKKGFSVLKTGVAIAIALVMIVSGIVFVRTGAEQVYAAAAVKDSEGYQTEGYFVKKYSDISTYKSTKTYPILSGDDYTDAQDWLFAGWYTDVTCATSIGSTDSGGAWAKFVHINVLSVKCQVENDTAADTDKTNMRLISTIDSLKYDTVGFKVRYNGGEELDFPVSKVFKRINASEANGNECGYSPAAFHDTSEYFVTYSLLNIANKNYSKPFYIEPYWITLDGTEVSGASRYARVEDSYLQIINVPVRLHQEKNATSGSATVSYDISLDEKCIYEPYTVDGVIQYDNGALFDAVTITADADAKTVTVTATEQDTAVQSNGMLANLRFQMTADTMPSTSTFGITSIDFNISNFVFKNFPLTYDGSVDISWYQGYEDSDTFAISSAADLYGLAALCNGDTSVDGVTKAVTFEGKTIYLASDITVNEGSPVGSDGVEGTEDDWATTRPTYDWTPIGYGMDSLYFNGTFDGQGNTISGLYFCKTEVTANIYHGLFGYVNQKGTLTDFKLTDTYMKVDRQKDSDQALLGSIAGQLSGDMIGVYSDAYVESEGTAVGGLIGRLNPGHKNNSKKLENCCFAGNVSVSTSTQLCATVGGIAGRAFNTGTTNIINCLNKGSVTYTYETAGTSATAIGGIIGKIGSEKLSDTYFVNIENCMSTGSVTAKCTADDSVCTTGVASIVGYHTNTKADSLTVKNTIGTSNSHTNAVEYYTDCVLGSESTGNSFGELTNEKCIGSDGYENTKVLGIYAQDNLAELAEGKSYYWVTTENGTPELKSFCDEWIDVAWYYHGNYTITTAEELYGFSALSKSYSFSGKTVTMGADITLNTGEAAVWAEGNATPKRALTPIGSSKAFTGIFDGQGHTISGLWVNASSGTGAGLFGQMGGTLSNVRLVNSFIDSDTTYTGSAVGFLSGNMTNVYSSAYVTSSQKETGGLVGRFGGGANEDNPATGISGCWFEGTVDVATKYAGGLVGSIDRGYNGKSLRNCLNTGVVKSTSTDAYVGGLVGGTADDKVLSQISISDSIHNGKVEASATTNVGAILGCTHVPTIIENVYTTQELGNTIEGIGNTELTSSNTNITVTVTGTPMVFVETENGVGTYQYTNLDVWSEEHTDGIWYAIEGAVPELKNFSSKTPIKSFTDYTQTIKAWYYNAFNYTNGSEGIELTNTEFIISTLGDLNGLADFVNTGTENFSGKKVTLANDIIVFEGDAAEWAEDASSRPETSWTPIGKDGKQFQGTFDGDYHSINGIYAMKNGSGGLGLFAYAKNCIIQNLSVTNSFFYLKRDGGNANVGSIIGYGNGTLTNVYSDAIIHSTGKGVGGIIGRSSAAASELTGCWFAGNIDVDFNSNDVNKDMLETGGLIGVIEEGTSVINTCLYNGDITFKFTSCDHDKKTAGVYVGGLCGRDSVCTQYKNSISAGSITGRWLDNEDDTDSTNNPTKLTWVGTIVGCVRNTESSATGAVYSLTDISLTVDYTEVTTTPTTTYAQKDGTTLDFSKVDSTWRGKEENLYGLGAQLWSELTFSDTEWAAVADGLPVPAAFAENSLEVRVGKPSTTMEGEGTADSPYLIQSIEDLAGFAILSQTNNFEGQYMKLTADLDMNPDEKAEEWQKGTKAATLPWYTTIGANDNGTRFAGHFDGGNHIIRGLSVRKNEPYIGLFNGTECGSSVKNLRLENSYFEQQGKGYTGSIISDCRGTLDNIYSDAIISSRSQQVGGIVARANGYDWDSETEKRTESTISNCWYAGKIHAVEDKNIDDYSATRIGGIVGNLIQGQWQLDNCLFTGTIDSGYTGSYAGLGGICGIVSAQKSSELETLESKLRLSSCISAGTIVTESQNAGKGAGALVGRVMAGVSFDETEEEDGTVTKSNGQAYKSSLEMEKVFATRESGSTEVGLAQTSTGSDSTGAEFSATPSVSGVAVWTHNADRLTGYCTEVTLDFGETGWLIREKGVPVPATFSDIVNASDVSTINNAIGLDAWSSYENASLQNAVHQGLGRYVLTFGSETQDSKETYEAYILKLVTDLGFTNYAGNMYIKQDGDWVLNVLYVETTGVTTITIYTGIEETLSSNLSASTVEADGEKNITLSMLKLTGTYSDNSNYGKTSYCYGNSFVIQLPNGHFIINDGGNQADYKGLMEYLKDLAGTTIAEDGTVTNPICIDAWTVSHQHNDHFGVVKGFIENPDDVKFVRVEAFYINEPNAATLALDGAPKLESQYQGIRMLKTSKGEATPVYWYHTGQTYYFNGVTMDVVLSQEQIPLSKYAKVSATSADGTDYNTTSTVLLFTTKNDQKIFIGGDANYVNMQYIMNAYGTNSTLLSGVDVFVALHHGKNTSYSIADDSGIKTFTDYLVGAASFDTVLYPCSLVYGDEADNGAYPFAGEANEYLNTKVANKYFHYGEGTILVTFGNEISVEKK